MAPRRRPLPLLLLPQLLAGWCSAYDNGAPNSKLPPMGWSSWVALSGDPAGCGHAFDYCSDRSVRQAAQDFHTVGLYDAGYVSPRPPSAAPFRRGINRGNSRFIPTRSKPLSNITRSCGWPALAADPANLGASPIFSLFFDENSLFFMILFFRFRNRYFWQYRSIFGGKSINPKRKIYVWVV